MRSSPFGPTARHVPVIGQGTWNIERTERAAAVRALRQGLDLGMTHIDTAEMYGDGAAEAIVGEAIAGRRDGVYLVSKVLPSNASIKGVVAACERSLRHLKTDRIDCYLLHWRGRYGLADTVAGFEQLKRDGKIAAWGVSNFDVDDLEELATVADFADIACNQVLYHLQARAIEHSVLPWCEARGVAVVGYSPFGQSGFPTAEGSAGRALAEIAAARGATARQIALAFLARRPALFAIPKAARGAHVVENAAAGDLVLSSEEMSRIDAAFPLGPRPKRLPMA